jgi:integrase
MSAVNPTAPAVPGKPPDTSATPGPNGTADKPAKPYPDFPLFPHATRRWAKKIRGQMHYFGPWSDPDGALKKYLEQKDALHAGRKPRPDAEAVAVKDVANAFLNAKKALLDAGELSPHTFANYKVAAEALVTHMGKARLAADLDPQDFAALRKKMAAKWGLYRLAVTMQHIRSVFKHAFEAGLILTPMRFGPGFTRPTKKAFRLHRAEQGPKLFSAEEVRRLIDGASVQLRAMLLLGINCGFGNSDCAHLPLSALDLDGGWLDYPRPKTGINRRCPLWPETVAALREALAVRPTPKDPEDAGLFFVTKYGGSWAKETEGGPVAKETKKLLNKLGISGRKGLGFYTLRHVFRTVADAAKDQPATDFIMGHEVQHMSAVYRETIEDGRLKAITDHVRGWLFPGQPAGVDAAT